MEKTHYVKFPAECAGTGKYKPADASKEVILQFPHRRVHYKNYFELRETDGAITKIRVTELRKAVGAETLEFSDSRKNLRNGFPWSFE